eukprot:764929-Hanusia_phi.AAC.2
MHGNGTLLFPDGHAYEGGFISNAPNGHGVLTRRGTRTEGKWQVKIGPAPPPCCFCCCAPLCSCPFPSRSFLSFSSSYAASPLLTCQQNGKLIARWEGKPPSLKASALLCRGDADAASRRSIPSAIRASNFRRSLPSASPETLSRSTTTTTSSSSLSSSLSLSLNFLAFTAFLRPPAIPLPAGTCNHSSSQPCAPPPPPRSHLPQLIDPLHRSHFHRRQVREVPEVNMQNNLRASEEAGKGGRRGLVTVE